MAANVRITQVLLKRGNTTAASNYTGPVGEVVIDTGLRTLRIQDGVTAGGSIITANSSGGVSSGITDAINANVTAANLQITALWANAGTQATSITTLLSNAAAQAASIATLTANAATQLNQINGANSAISTANVGMKSYVDAQISTISLTPGPQGNTGPQGIQGIQGNVGSQGIQGIQGIQGNTGAQGISVTLVGNVSIPEDLTFSGNAGEAYIVNSTGNLYFWNTGITSWVDIGPIVGPEGPRGAQGIQGNTGSQGIQGIQGNVGPQGIQGNVGPGVPVGGSAGQVLAKVDGDDYNTEWVDQTGGAADTGSFGFVGTTIYNKDDYNQGLYIAPGGESSSYVYVPGNSESDSTPIQITNSSGTGEVRLQAYDRRWVFNASGAITFPDSTVQSTAFTGNVASLVNGQYSVVLESDGYLAMPNDSNIRFNYGYVGQSANIQNNALRVSGGNAVVINTNEDGNSWQFTADGNLVLPTIVDFMSSPAGYLGGNIVFGDGTVQNTAYIRTAPVTVSTSAEGVEGDLWYNTADGRLYVDVNNNGTITWVDASPSVIPGNMVAWDNDAIEFPDGSLQATAAGIYAGNTAPTAGFSWYNTEDGRTYNRVNGVWVDANPAVLPGDIVTFNDSGNITLPVGGQVTWANGRSILHGITSGTVANTGDISFEGMKIIGNNIDVPVAGLISLVPVKTFGGWDFEAWGQYIDIYPTNGFDAPHIHITAGSGAESTGDLFLGDDSRYVQVNHNGTVSIQSDSGSSTYNWQFDTTGNLVLPTNGSINYANGVSILSGITTTGDYSNSNVASYLPTYSGNIAGNIAKNGHTWTFAEDGTTAFPSNTIKSTSSVSIQTPSSTLIPSDWQGGGGWNQNFYANLATTGGSGTGLTVDVVAGSGYINIEAITINNPGSGYTNGDVITIDNENNLPGTFTLVAVPNTWDFSTTGTLTFPNETVQTTAWTGILPNPTYSGSNNIGVATPAPLNLNNSAEATLLTQLNLLNTGGGAGAGSAIDFWTYSSINDVPEVRLQAVDDGDYSADFAIKIKQNGNEGNGSLTTTWTFGSDGDLTLPGGPKLVAGYPGLGIYDAATLAGTEVYLSGTDGVNWMGIAEAGVPMIGTSGGLWTFGTDGGLTFPDDTVQTTAYVKTTGAWTVTTGSNTYSFTVPTNGVYQLWVRGNIPNGIVTYSATAVVTNPNVPVLGSQRGWYYEAGNALVLTSIPTQFVGTDNTISNASPSVGTTTNVFEFGITNNSGSTQSVEWGYTKL